MGAAGAQDNAVLHLARARCVLLVKVLFLTLVGLLSAVIPEAASTAVNLKWLILLESFPPILVQYTYGPTDYLGLHRAAGIWVCNTLVLMAAYFIDKMYLRRDISGSDTLMKFVADHPNSNTLAFPAIFAMTGLFGMVFALIFGVCACVRNNVLKRISSPGLKLLIILGLILSSCVFLPALPFKFMLPIQDTMMIFLNLIRPFQLMLCTFIVTVTLTIPDFNTNWIFRIFVTSTCLAEGVLCLCSAVQIHKFEFVFSGIVAFFWAVATVCLTLKSSSLIAQGGTATQDENYEMPSSN